MWYSINSSVRKNGHLFEKMDILNYFFEEPERKFHLRELARLARLAPSTVSKNLEQLVKKRILISKKDKGFKLFSANSENHLYRDLKLFYNIFQIRISGLVDHIIEIFNQPKSIILFGSFRKGENIPRSDIDIFIEVTAKKELDLSKFEGKLGHKIQLFQFTSKEISAMQKNNKELFNNIANGIVLEGFFEVFK